MELPNPLRNRAAALARYGTRKVHTWHSVRQMWLCNTAATMWTANKVLRKEYTLSEAADIVGDMPESAGIKFIFIDTLGEPEKINLADFEGEEIYNCTSITFEAWKPQ